MTFLTFFKPLNPDPDPENSWIRFQSGSGSEKRVFCSVCTKSRDTELSLGEYLKSGGEKYYFLYTPLSVKLKEKDWECFKTYRMQNTVPSDGRKFRDRKRDEGFWYWEPSKKCQNKATKLTQIILKTRSCWQCCGSGRILSGSDLEVRIQIIKTEFVLLKFRLFC